MGHASLDDLLELAAGIMQLDADEASLKGREWKEAKKQYEAAVEQFNSRRKGYVDSLFIKGDDWSIIPDNVLQELNNIEVKADPSWNSAIQYTRDNLLPNVRKEAVRSPIVRDIIKWTPIALAVAAVIAYFGIRLTSGVDVTAPIESKLGLQQRAEAVEKVIRHDDWMDTRARRGGWIKGILFWPIEPDEVEIKSAGEFVSVALEGYDVLLKEQQICGTLVAGNGDKLSKEQTSFIGYVAEEIRRVDIQWQRPPLMTVLQPIKAKFPC